MSSYNHDTSWYDVNALAPYVCVPGLLLLLQTPPAVLRDPVNPNSLLTHNHNLTILSLIYSLVMLAQITWHPNQWGFEAENVRDKFSKYIQVLQSKTQIEVIISCSSDTGSNFLKDYSSQQWLQWSNTCNTSPLTVDDCYVSFPPNLYKSSIKSISERRNALYKQYTPRWQLCSCKLWWLLGLISTKSI